MTNRRTDPWQIILGAAETRKVTCVLTAELAAGETPSSPVVTLYDLSSGPPAVFAAGLTGSAALVGDGSAATPYAITQSVTGLTEGRRYRLAWRWTVAALSPADVREVVTEILVE